ncbi:hypothetical protein Tco_0551352 [Tanacetum coccineum]
MGCTDCSHLALGWFRKTTLYSTYQDLVYPVEEPSSWVRPDGLQVVTRVNERSYTTNIESNIEYEAAYTNNYVRSQEYEAAYTNNYVRSQEYEAAYTNNYVRSQEYEAAYNNMDGGSQGYQAAYTNFNSMFEQANINFGGQSQHPLPTMPLTFITDDLIAFSGETSPSKYMKFFLEQKVAESRSSKPWRIKMRSLLAAKDAKRGKKAKLDALNEVIAEAMDEIETQETNVEILDGALDGV